MKFYQLPNSNCFPTVCYFFSREATSATSAPCSLFIIFAFAIYFPLHFFSDLLNQKYKNTLLQFICSAIYLSYLPLLPHVRLPILRRRTPEGIDNPFNSSGCEVLLFVCRCCLRCVGWFSYWFDNLGLTTKGNTYHLYTASSLPLWGNINCHIPSLTLH